MRVIIVGGGISGLSLAWLLAGRGIEVRLHEARTELGGSVLSTSFAGRQVDLGPDSFLVSGATTLNGIIEGLGLGQQLVSPAASGVGLVRGGSLVEMPADLVMGLPMSRRATVGLAWSGRLRAAVEPMVPWRHLRGDLSVGDLVRTRFGSAVAERLTGPLLEGIYGGSLDELSARAATPELFRLASAGGSLVSALRPRLASGRASAFRTLTQSLGGMMPALARALPEGSVRMSSQACAVMRGPSGLTVEFEDGRREEADKVVLAVPAFAASRLLASSLREVSGQLSGIGYSSVGSVLLSYPHGQPLPAGMGGFLVPAGERLWVGACTLLSQKWEHLAGGPTILRCSLGRHRAAEMAGMSDSQLVEVAHAEISGIIGLTVPPIHSHVHRWWRALPVYRVGHTAISDLAAPEVAHLGGIHLLGGAYRGSGLSACVEGAAALAAALTKA